MHFDNKKKDILILGIDPMLGCDDTILTAEVEYSIDFTEQQNKFCVRLNYNGSVSYIFINENRIYQFKGKGSELNAI